MIVLAAGAACVPQVQLWAARRLLASLGPPGSTLEGASAGLGRVSLRGLRIGVDDGVLVVPQLEAEVGLVPAVLGRKFSFRNVVARGWTLDLTGPGPAVAPAGEPASPPLLAEAIEVAFHAFNVPERVSLESVDLEGTIILSDDLGRQRGKAGVVVTGGGLAAGREGQFRCSMISVLDDPAAPVSSVTLVGALTTALDAEGTFTRADLKMGALAKGRQFPAGVGLEGAASAERSAGRASYSLTLNRGQEKIAFIDAQGSADSRRIAGSWRLDLKDTDLAPFALGRTLPAFTAAGEGSYDLDPATGDVHALGKIRASGDRLGVVARGLSALGRVDGVADFDMARIGSSLRVDRLQVSLAGDAPIGTVRALQPFEFSTDTGELKVARPSGDLVGISITGIPTAWLRGPLPGVALEGSPLKGDFAMRAEGGRLALRTNAPLTGAGMSVSRGGRVWASGLEVSLFVLADYASQGWQAQLTPLAVSGPDGVRMLSVEARVGRLAGPNQALKAAGSWSASLPAMKGQPFASRLPALAAGDATGSFEASLGPTRAVRVKVALKNLALEAGGAPLPSVAADLRADFGSGMVTTFAIPLHLDYGTRSSDLEVSGTLASDVGGPLVDAALSAGSVSAADLGVVAGIFGARAPAASPARRRGGASRRSVLAGEARPHRVQDRLARAAPA